MKLKTLLKPLKLDYINEYITDENFPYEKKEKGEFELLHFNRYISTEEALEEIEKIGRPATLHEVLLWAKDNWKKEVVVALGSVWQNPSGNRGVGCLHYVGGRRRLYLDWIVIGWSSDFRFLVVRKSLDISLETRILALENKMKRIEKVIKI